MPRQRELIQRLEPAWRAGRPSAQRASELALPVDARRAITTPASRPTMPPPTGVAARAIPHPKGTRARRVAALPSMAANTMTNIDQPWAREPTCNLPYL
jgi:hypothetical protein